MANREPTIYDVAKLAGVSVSTVSRVLNTPHKVNEDTRKSVLSAIDQLNFTPKAESRAWALSQTKRIGVLTPYFTLPSFVQRLHGVATGLASTHYELVIYPVDSMDRLNGYVETLSIARNLDGLIVISLQVSDSAAERFVKNGLPTVLVEYPQPQLNCVLIDDIAGGKLAAEYLLKKRRRSFAFVGDTELPDYGVHPIPLRYQGYRHTLNEAGIMLQDEHIQKVANDAQSMSQFVRKVMMTSNPPDAVFAATDTLALGVLKAARQLGYRVPDDIAIIGFDDLDIAEYVNLTTIRQHLDESGRVAVELMMAQLANSARPPRHIQLPLEVIERETA